MSPESKRSKQETKAAKAAKLAAFAAFVAFAAFASPTPDLIKGNSFVQNEMPPCQLFWTRTPLQANTTIVNPKSKAHNSKIL
jgi:hypothetical protein